MYRGKGEKKLFQGAGTSFLRVLEGGEGYIKKGDKKPQKGGKKRRRVKPVSLEESQRGLR